MLTVLGFSQYLTIVGLFATAGMFYLTSMNDLLPATRCKPPHTSRVYSLYYFQSCDR